MQVLGMLPESKHSDLGVESDKSSLGRSHVSCFGICRAVWAGVRVAWSVDSFDWRSMTEVVTEFWGMEAQTGNMSLRL